MQSSGLPARFGGFLSATDLFDVALFGLSGGEAELMDAQQRLLLEASFEVGACKACMCWLSWERILVSHAAQVRALPPVLS